jgi:uncharacterized protein (TIGR03663 family)
MVKGVILGLLAATLVALALRCPDLGRRPMHNDEAVNAIKFRSLWEQGSYQYDPKEHHGPALFYATLVWAKLTRAGDFAQFDEARLRGLTVLFGIGLILLLPLIADGLGRHATVCAGVLTAISPAMVYYSRDYIHEMLLVFFTFLAAAGGWRYYRSRRIGWALLTGAAIGLMQSTKETFVLALAALATALVANGLLRRRGGAGGNPAPFQFNAWHAAAAMGVWLLTVLAFFSSFFTHAGGPLDALRTYLPWLDRAAGDSPHVHPWNFYLARLLFFHVGNGPVWSEGLILGLALVGFLVAVVRKGPPDAHAGFVRFAALYTLALTLIYSAIAYKTPWCMLGFWQGTILLAGVGAVAVLQRARGRWMKFSAAILLLGGAGQLAGQAWQASERYAADRRNPWVYAQTSPDILQLVGQLDALARVDPQGRHLLMKVMAPGSDYWPLPWYLRAFDQVGWWSEMPANPFAPVMIVSTKFHADLDRTGTHVMTGLFELRPDAFLELYVQSDLWRAYVEAKSKGRGNSP